MLRLSAAVAALILGVSAPSAREESPASNEMGVPSAPSVGADSLNPGGPARQPYLSDAAAPDTLAILPPPPAGHTAVETADRAIFTATRALNGTARWDLATSDVADGAGAILNDFSCVLGQRIDQTKFPGLMTLLERVRLDVARATRGPKEHYRRLRPFVGNEAPICVDRTPKLADSFSYPSGHSGQGWTYALIMAQMMPEKATQFLVRGRLYGESRVVCGVHWMSDVSAARLGASALFAALQGNAGFRADLERARADLAKAVATPGPKPDAALCAREEEAARQPLL